MFEKISRLWKGDAPLNDEYQLFVKMLKKARELYLMILHAMNTGIGIPELEAVVYNRDIEINKIERKIRKSLVTLLAMDSVCRSGGCLVLMSIVKDAERLGDFCKNLYETSAQWGKVYGDFFYDEEIVEYSAYVSEVFDKTIEAFEEEDDSLAAEIIQDEVKWAKRMDAFIIELMNSDVSTKEGICTVLIVRTLKRIQAHLSNIASSVVLPVHHLDHRPKHLRTDRDT